MNDPLEQRLAQIAEENGLPEHEAGVDWYFMRLGVKAAQEWYPIGTEPAGQWILVHYAEFITSKDPNWTWGEDALRTSIAKFDDDGLWVDERGNCIVTPTHWQHLNNPPPEPKQ